METSITLSFIFSWVLPVIILLMVTGISIFFIRRQYVDKDPDKTPQMPRLLKRFVPADVEESISKTPSEGTNAGFIHRVVAFWIDSCLFSIPEELITTLLVTDKSQVHLITTLFAVAFLMYKIYMEVVYGQTIGKFILGIKVGSYVTSHVYVNQILKRNLFYLTFTLLTCFGIIQFVPKYKLSDISIDENEYMVIATVIILILAVLIDTLWYFVKNRGQTIHDVIGGTTVNIVGNRHKNVWWILFALIVIQNIVKNGIN
jgi:uncharacterized RDD family membrane protein YckC